MVTRVNWNRNYYYTYYFTPTIRIAGDWTFQIYDRLNDSSPIYTGVVQDMLKTLLKVTLEDYPVD